MPDANRRLIFQNQHRGLVRYQGPVNGTHGDWLGIEWDDASRGKHDGVGPDGTKYFDCRQPGSGSFVRPSNPHIDFGRDFLSALVDKYIDVGTSSQQVEIVTLGSSNGKIQVEAPGFDQVRSRFARLDRLKQVSLDFSNVASAAADSKVWLQCQDMTGVNLSDALIYSWADIVTIIRSLNKLEELDLSGNRLQSTNLASGPVFERPKTLHLNRTWLEWADLVRISGLFPRLEQLSFGFNNLTSPTAEVWNGLLSWSLKSLNLDGNGIRHLQEILPLLHSLRSLDYLGLASNAIEVVEHIASFTLASLTIFTLVANPMQSWTSLHAISAMFPKLSVINLQDTPLSKSKDSLYNMVARLPGVGIIDGTTITDNLRRDSEMFYMSRVNRDIQVAGDLEFERIQVLLEKYGPVDQPKQQETRETLSRRLIAIQILQLNDALPTDEHLKTLPPYQQQHSIELLPTMTGRLIKLKIRKTLTWKRRHDPRLWALLPAHSSNPGWLCREIASNSDTVSFMGLQEDCFIGIF